MTDDLMKRPSGSDEYVRRRAAELALPQVMGWCRQDEVDPSEEDVMYSLMKVLRSSGDDGFHIAKALEDDHGWASVDSQLVDILDSGFYDDAVKELTKKWVTCLNIQPQFKIGDSVTASRIFKKDVGVIVEIRSDTAEYGIRYPDQKDGWRTIVSFENTTLAEAN